MTTIAHAPIRNAGIPQETGAPSFIKPQKTSLSFERMVINGGQVQAAPAKESWLSRIIHRIFSEKPKPNKAVLQGLENDFGKFVADKVFNKFSSDLREGKPLSERNIKNIKEYITSESLTREINKEVRFYKGKLNLLATMANDFNKSINKPHNSEQKQKKLEENFSLSVEKSFEYSEKQLTLENELAKIEQFKNAV